MTKSLITVEQFTHATKTIEQYIQQQKEIADLALGNIKFAEKVLKPNTPKPLIKILARGSVIRFTKVNHNSSLRTDTDYVVKSDGVSNICIINPDKADGESCIRHSDDMYKFVVVEEIVERLYDPNPITAYPDKLEAFLDIEISTLRDELPARAYKVFKKYEIATWRVFFKCPFTNLRNLGVKTADELRRYFDAMDIDHSVQRELYEANDIPRKERLGIC